MDPVTAIAIGSTALSAGSSIMAGRAQSKQLASEAALADSQAQGVDLQALQASERRREDLRAAMASIAANRAARGLSLDSPSAVAVEREIRRQSVRDENVDRVGYMNQASSIRMGARMKRIGARNANTMGYLNAASTIMSNGSDIYAASKG